MATTTQTGKFTFTDANLGGTRTINVPFPSNEVTASDFENTASIMSGVWSGFGAYGNWWTNTEVVSDKIDISD